MSQKRKLITVAIIVAAIILIDQVLKIWIKTNLMLGESIHVTDWFQLYFVENPGMAFGMQIFGKLFLTIFRILASFGIIYFVYKLIRNNYKFGFVVCISMILAGAVGNLIDSIFYGEFFTHSINQIASLFPEGGGYAPYFYGKVVDMFYFPLIKDASGEALFFRPVFNIADSAVSIGVALSMIFYRKELNRSLDSKKKNKTEEDANV